MRLLAALLVATLLAPAGNALTLLEERAGPHGERLLRLAIDEDRLEARAMEGTPWLDGAPLSNTSQRVDREPVPWRGFERTVQVQLAGNGSALLVDGASGFVVRLDGHHASGQAPGNGSRPHAPGPAEGPGQQGGPPPVGADRAPTEGGHQSAGQHGPTPVVPLDHPDTRETGPSWLWGLAALGLAAVALAPLAGRALKRRAFQARLVGKRLLDRWGTGGEGER